MRRVALCALLLAVLVHGVVIGAVGGAALFAHSHHGHGMHWHAAASAEAASRVAARHVHDHDSGGGGLECPAHRHYSGCEDGHRHGSDAPSGEPAEGVVISLPDLDHTVVRGVTIPEPLRIDGPLLAAAWRVVATARVVSVENRAPDRWARGSPRHLCALGVPERLMRTSRALLI